jgi:hypothetical protein
MSILSILKPKYKYDTNRAEIEAEIKMLKDVLQAAGITYKTGEVLTIEAQRTWLISQLKHVPYMIIGCSERNGYWSKENTVLQTKVRNLEGELDTLKMLLELTEEDKQEWAKHKELFRFMLMKNKLLIEMSGKRD